MVGRSCGLVPTQDDAIDAFEIGPISAEALAHNPFQSVTVNRAGGVFFTDRQSQSGFLLTIAS